MRDIELRDLGLTEKNDGGHGGGGHAHSGPVQTAAGGTAGVEYLVDGMTCSHCVRSVTQELSALDGVTGVSVELNAGGVSRVRVVSVAPLETDRVREAVEEAGYSLTSQP